jgi:transcriptional regulator with XRE-family HTH domain
MQTLAERVAALRSARSWSQSELARRSGVTQQNVNSVELGKVKRPRYTHELARALDTTVEYLLTGKGEPRLSAPTVAYVSALPSGDAVDQSAAIMFAPDFIKPLGIRGPLRYVRATASDTVPELVRPGDVIVIDDGISEFAGDGVYLLRFAGDGERLRFCSRRAGDGSIAVASASPHLPAEIVAAATPLPVAGRAVMSVRTLV